ncbi:MAG: outer membrane beta-barrel protein [Bacteroidetes bacterium]|nr:outer membrane beta-barrel protein [Bacteroidota bacterium]
MKRLALIVFTVIVAGSTSLARDPKFGGGVHGGISISAFQELISDAYGIGPTFGAHGDLQIIPAFTARLSVDYHTFSPDDDKLKALVGAVLSLDPSTIASISGGSINVFAVTVNAIGKVQTRSRVTPYGLFGLGIHSINLSDIEGTTTTGEQGKLTEDDVDFKGGTKFGLNFAIGSDFKVSKSVTLFFQIGYTLVFTEDESNGAIPILVGVTFGV